MLPRERLTPRDPSDTDDPPNYIEGNDPEDALADTDPDRSILDEQNPDAHIKQVREPNNPRTHSPHQT
jgi:hypothetical protein